MTDATGIPISPIVGGANIHEIKLLQATIEHSFVRWPRKHHELGKYICLDKGWQSASMRTLVESVYHSTTHVRSCAEEKREL